jgi:hypothetical protein
MKSFGEFWEDFWETGEWLEQNVTERQVGRSLYGTDVLAGEHIDNAIALSIPLATMDGKTKVGSRFSLASLAAAAPFQLSSPSHSPADCRAGTAPFRWLPACRRS